MKAADVLKLLEKHEAQCDKRYAEIQDKLKSLDGRVWGLYGVAAMTDLKTKNISYNILDIVSKNFYGLFIYYIILQISKDK